MKKNIFHAAESRGHIDHGWTNAFHSFSFAGYHNPERMNFGALRVLNDDTIKPGSGVGVHPHDNMEIISIVLSGEMEHKDSMNFSGIIKPGDVQIMSAGTGIRHSEYNKSEVLPLELLQIWVFPYERNLKPRYDQKSFEPGKKINQFQNVVFPMTSEKDLGGVKIHQNAWFHLTTITPGSSLVYNTHLQDMGVYVFVIDGRIMAENLELKHRDGAGFWEGSELHFTNTSNKNAEILLMEVPV